MASQLIDTHYIDEGLDRQQLAQLKQRFLTLNQQRLERASTSLSERQQQFILILPLLFHTNHPMLPGYISSTTPAGIYGFKPEKETLRMAKILARSFQYTRDLTEKTAAIDALFLMGSAGSIAHSDTSDLDIWVCHNPALTKIEQQTLERKCELVRLWAAQYIHLETHFFLMTGDSFQSGKCLSLSSEASGSAQHYLLLDEFYRTALWVAGKVPLWWFVPASQERNYADYTRQLLGKRFIKSDGVIDFGGLPEIPPNEFIGAGIWQLYKAIESPYKSVLKLLLLEVYAAHTQLGIELREQNPEPLALDFKRAIYAGDPDVNALDPYIMIYERVQGYLQAHGQDARVELVRRCLYFKANKPLSRKNTQAQKSWQRLLLESLVKEWKWDSHQLHMLDNRAYWKSPHVIAERVLLVNELNHSYRLLSDLNKQLGFNAAISSEELMILGRKLHAAFERKAGKIEWINPGISRDLSEPSLCIVEERSNAGEVWQLLRGSQQDLSLRLVKVEPIKRARSLVELLLWCQVNGILVPGTHVDIVSHSCRFTPLQKQQLLQSMQHWLPDPQLGVQHHAFTFAAQTERLLMIFNLGVEPQAELHKKGMHMLSSQSDPLGFSGFKENLVLTVDIVQLNSWGELVVRRYEKDGLINALLHYLRLLPPGQLSVLPELTIRCFSIGQGNNIAQRLTELWRDIIACFYSGARSAASRYILEMGEEYLLLQLLQQLPQVYRYNSYEKLLEKLAQAQVDYSPIVVDRHGLRDKPLAAISQTLKAPVIYLFYQIDQQGTGQRMAQVTVADEKGSLFSAQVNYYNQQTFLKPLLGFIRNTLQRQLWFNQPVNSQLLDNIQVYELESAGKHQLSSSRHSPWLVQQRLLPPPMGMGFFMNIKAIAELDEGVMSFTIFCNEQEFSALVYGDTLFKAVAQYIVAHRPSGEFYPCYITDLDLSLCHESLAQQTGLQLSHYLHIKAELEQELNRALKALH